MNLYDMIACPMCKLGLVALDDDRLECCGCRRVYESSDGILNMMPDGLRNTGQSRDQGWHYWSKMQSIYKNRVKTDSSLELVKVKTEKDLYEDFMNVLLKRMDGAGCILYLGGSWGMNRNWADKSTFYFVVDPDDEEVKTPSMDFMKELYPFYGTPFPFIKGVGEYLPVRNECIDVVIIQDALDHFLFPRSVIHECYRILLSGGTLAIMADVEDAGMGRNYLQDLAFVLKRKGIRGVIRGACWKLAERINPRINRHGHINEFSCEEIRGLLKLFSYLEVKQLGVMVFPHLDFFGAQVTSHAFRI